MSPLSTSIIPVLFAFSSLSHVLAFDKISIQDTVEAGKDAQVSITNDLSTGSSSFDAGFTNYNVYLSVSPPGWGSNPVCVLINGSDISTTDFTVKVPASVGPSGSNYTLVTMEYNSDLNADGPSGFEYADDFTLTGGTGVWSAFETDPKGPRGLGDPDAIPCSAYDCARQCNQKFYPENFSGDDMTANKNTYECVAACPGVTYAAWDSNIADTGGDEDEDSSDGSSSSSFTSSAAATTTASSSTSATSAPSSSTTRLPAHSFTTTRSVSSSSPSSSSSDTAASATTTNQSSSSASSSQSVRVSLSAFAAGIAAMLVGVIYV